MICIESYVAYCTPLHSKPGCFVEACKLPRFVILGMVYDWFDHASPIVSLICWIETVPTIRSTSRAMSSSCCRCGVARLVLYPWDQPRYVPTREVEEAFGKDTQILSLGGWKGEQQKECWEMFALVRSSSMVWRGHLIRWAYVEASPFPRQSPWDRKHPHHPMVWFLSKASGCSPGLPGLRSSKSPRLWWRTWCKTHWSSSPWILWTTTAMAWRWWDFPRKAWFTIWLWLTVCHGIDGP